MSRNQFAPAFSAGEAAVLAMALACFALWLFWPDMRGPGSSSRHAHSQRTRYVFRTANAGNSAWLPWHIVLPSPYGPAGLLEEEETESLSVMPVRAESAALLRRVALDGTAPQSVAEQGWGVVLSAGPYRPAPIETPVFPPSAVGLRDSISVRASDELIAKRFDTSGLSAGVFPTAEKPWTIRACIETDIRGNVEHVFLDEPSQYGDVNSAALRALYRCRVMDGGTPVAGTLILSGPGGLAQTDQTRRQ